MTLVAACPSGDFTVRQPDVEAGPLAQAGTGSTVAFGTAVMLDGSASHTADGTTVTAQWTIVTKPSGSAAAIADATALTTTCVLDLVGDYTFQLTAIDGAGLRGTSQVTFHATAHRPQLTLSVTGTAEWRRPVHLHAAVAADAGTTLVLAWTLQKPAGSTAVLADATTTDPSFTPDLEGDYVAMATATVPQVTVTSTLPLPITAHRVAVPFRVNGVAWSPALQRAVITDDSGRVHVVDPVSGADSIVPGVTGVGTPVVAPDDHHVAVVSDTALLVVNLDTLAVEGTHPIPSGVAGYVFTSSQRIVLWGQTPIAALDLATDTLAGGTVTTSGLGLLTPDRHALYLQSSTLQHFDALATPPVLVRERSLGFGILMLSTASILLNNGTVLGTTDIDGTDLVAVGALPDSSLIEAAAQSPTTGDLVVVATPSDPGPPPSVLALYSLTTLVPHAHIPVPTTTADGFAGQTQVMFVAAASDGTAAYLLGYSRTSGPATAAFSTVPL